MNTNIGASPRISAEETAVEIATAAPPLSQRREDRIDLSIVIPFHDEQDSAGQVVEECRAALDAMSSLRGEIIVIDDGSADATGSILDSAAHNDSRIRVLRFRTNRGQAPALYHGLKIAEGTILVTLDGDGQNNPANITSMIDGLHTSGADLVSGVRIDRQDSRLRRIMSRLANRIRGAILNDDVTDSGCALKVFRRQVANALIPIQTLYSFIPALAKAAGHKVVECPVDHRQRIGGKTHYGLSVFLWRPALDMVGVWWFSRRCFSQLPEIKRSPAGANGTRDGIAGKKLKSPNGTALLTIGIAIVFLTQLGSYGLMEPDEGRFAEIGREMAAPDGNLIMPTLNGIPHFQKPPLIYWLTAVSMKLFGISEFGARLPSALSAIATLLLTMGIARILFRDPRIVRFTLVILASSPLFLFFGRTLTPDMHMTFWITAAIFCLVHSREEDPARNETAHARPWGWLFFVCIGLGFLTKGPVALLVPLSAAIGYTISLRRIHCRHGDEGVAEPRLRIPWVFGLPLALLIGFSWFIVVTVKNPDLASFYLKNELVERIGSGSHGRSKPIWFFIPVLLAGFLPWTLISAPILPAAFRNRTAEFGFFAGWIIVPFVVLSLSNSKLPTYVLPLFPGLSIALAAGIALASRREKCLGLGLRAATACVLLIVAALPIVVPQFFIKPSPSIPAGSLVFSIVVLVAVVFWLSHWSRTGDKAIISLGVIALLGWVALPSQLNSWNDLFSQQACVKPLADRILSDTSQDSTPPRVIACEIRAHGLSFYLGRTVEITRKDADLFLPMQETAPLTPPLHESPQSVSRLQPGTGEERPVFVVTRTDRYETDFARRGWTLLQTAGDFVLLRR